MELMSVLFLGNAELYVSNPGFGLGCFTAAENADKSRSSSSARRRDSRL